MATILQENIKAFEKEQKAVNRLAVKAVLDTMNTQSTIQYFINDQFNNIIGVTGYIKDVDQRNRVQATAQDLVDLSYKYFAEFGMCELDDFGYPLSVTVDPDQPKEIFVSSLEYFLKTNV